MVRVAVCDDEKNTTAEIKLALADIFTELAVVHEIDGFFSAKDLCHAMEAGARYDLIFLDIRFAKGEIDGVEAGRRIREIYDDDAVVSIVYISWVESYAMQLFEIRPLDFLLKPLTRRDIENVVKTYLRIFVPGGGGGYQLAFRKNRVEHMIFTKNIVYLEARGRKVVIHLRDGREDDFYGALRDVYEEQLKGCDFLFAHASYLINFDYITTVKYNCLHIKGRPTPLPISEGRRKEMRNRYTAILKRRRGV